MRLAVCAALAASFCSLGAAVHLPVHQIGNRQLSSSVHDGAVLEDGHGLVGKRRPRAAQPTKQQAASKKNVITDMDAAMKNQEAAEAKKRQGTPQARTMTASVPGVLSTDETQIEGLNQYITEEPMAVLDEGSVLPSNSSLNNTCGYLFTNQDDGNLVLYHSAGGLPIWSSNTYGAGGGDPEGKKDFTVKMDKGALKIFPFGPTKKSNRPPIWQTDTSGNNKAVLTRDGRVVIVDSGTGEVKVKLGTVPKVQCNIDAFKKAEALPPSGSEDNEAGQLFPEEGGDATGGLSDWGSDTSGGLDWGSDTSGGADMGTDTSGGLDWGSDTSGGLDWGSDTSGGADWGSDTSGGLDWGSDTSGGDDLGTDTSGGFDWGSDTSGGDDMGSDTSGGFDWGSDTSGGADWGTDTSGGLDWGSDTTGGDDLGTDTSGGLDWGSDTSGGADWGTDTSGGTDWMSAGDGTEAATEADSEDNSFSWGSSDTSDVTLADDTVDSSDAGLVLDAATDGLSDAAGDIAESDDAAVADESDSTAIGGFGADTAKMDDNAFGDASWDDTSFAFGGSDGTSLADWGSFGDETTFGGDWGL